MTDTSDAVTWLTNEAYDRLKNELEYLSGEGRVEIAKKIELAREEGDLRENGGYHAAKEEQGKREARIRVLKQLLENAQVGEAAPDDGTVAAGSVVTVDMFGDEMLFLLGSREAAEGTEIDVYSEKSPLGSAILGHKVGDEVSFTAPNGKQVPVKILKAEPYRG
ncbi:transcription elongation factor GreA [Spongisporangium articulatum]|uniref:Transcription elongation factor GreA n=1 Tax=Spongisporangium articulatum TaxID=3362603 RepID=A0ABW8AR91_9ACTN